MDDDFDWPDALIDYLKAKGEITDFEDEEEETLYG